MTPEDIQQLAGLAGSGIEAANGNVVIHGTGPVLPARLPIAEVAAVALAEVGDGARELSVQAGGDPGLVETSVEKGAQSIISFALTKVDGEAIPRTNQSNPFVRHYRCGDGRWVYLHGGFPTLAARLADLLGLRVEATFDEVGAAVATWTGQELEDAIAARRGCGGLIRTEAEWLAHPQGAAVAALDVVDVRPVAESIAGWEPSQRRPLTGLRVLDLTRVLAGPTCGRTLAALGADVLQVTGPNTPNVPSFIVDTGQGKRRTFGDLDVANDLAATQQLAVSAHVVVQGYRPGVVERFGLDAETLRSNGFRGIYANVSAFGPNGPFADRAGWEQLAQSVSGIAVTEGAIEKPSLLPAAATDYTTGYLLAGAIVRQLGRGLAADIDASLCQTAGLLMRAGPRHDPADATGIGTPEMETVVSGFGRVERLTPNVTVEGLDLTWRSGPMGLGTSLLTWKGWSNW